MSQDRLLVELARFIERVNAVARTGLAFKAEGFDAERYEELLMDAARMQAAAVDATVEDAETIRRGWRDAVIAGYEGYVTPAVGCGIVAFNERNQVLMIQRPSGKWWFPTGFCEVGISAAENVAKEAMEEVGLRVEPLRLMALIDSRKTGDPWRHIYAILFYCGIVGGELRRHPLEVKDLGFFTLDSLPQPLHGKDRKWIQLAREFHFDGRVEPYFDRV
ncbi:MAG TPA: NUDIX hydrolase N-terminal domain-containing protein [Candidatus Binataceae bacterium]|jgi:ADP-ribose pyrophosphatase YjhB (NUDIX family)